MRERVEWAVRAYRRLLRLLPAGYRAEAEPELVSVFRDAYARLGSAGGSARARFWARTAADTLVTSWSARVEGCGGRTGARVADGWFHGLGADLRQALRRLSREPGHALLPLLTLGVGIAATVTVLTLVRGVLLRRARKRVRLFTGRRWIGCVRCRAWMPPA